ncbi:rhodanese-like domain-containing protein [Tumebacillus sp. BK434]|uniref:rhodanese-like domain-containing protein n=1 Tax=Tumebacillus sp. BK434 TaxID=2512169 RepID=UPI001FB486B9|nr:rhodanese-like domain-containing protein [Tumebacillus sp. BK434]
MNQEQYRHFANKLAFETDPADVRIELESGECDFVLLDARSREAYAGGHLPGAVSLPYREISAESTAAFDKNRLIVTYCWSPACNAAAKAGLRLSELGFAVKEMFGGVEYWQKEGGQLHS